MQEFKKAYLTIKTKFRPYSEKSAIKSFNGHVSCCLNEIHLIKMEFLNFADSI